MSDRRRVPRLAIIGTVGLPANYGGFETLAANLVLYAERENIDWSVEVYCSGKAYKTRLKSWHGATLKYIPLDANGPVSPLYDFWSMVTASWRGADVILVLGVSGAISLPILRVFTRARYVVNVDGIEWRRAKWSKLAARFLRLSEAVAVRFAHQVIGDNQGIVDYINDYYARPSVLIPYGGDHAGQPSGLLPTPDLGFTVPTRYALMLCRIEPENNVHTILNGFAEGLGLPLVAVGNWEASSYGRDLKARFKGHAQVCLLDPVYEPHQLFALRNGAAVYVHGHSAGGTNPALVEMMYLGKPVVAFDCVYNRYSTEEQAIYFSNGQELANIVAAGNDYTFDNGQAMRSIALRRYRWDEVGRAYFDIIRSTTSGS